MAIQLKSKFLQNYFCDDNVEYDIFVSSYRSAIRVLNNPDFYPTADLNFYTQLEFELELEAPVWCKP
jgi:hypothetical protein